MSETIKFHNANALFSKSLKLRINDYFSHTFQKKTGNRRIFIKATVLLSTFIWTSKILHFVLFVLIPVLLVGWLPTLIGVLIAGVVCGISLATVFQLAHVVTETEFKTIEGAKVEEEWMVHQIQSTANFATKSKVLTWMLGGLNLQVEHHLFPKISHVHYPALNRIVQQTCREHNIPYLEFSSFWKAFQSHVKVIQLMSK